MLFNKKEKIVFIDVDDTLADTRRAIHELYTHITGNKAGDINVKSKKYMDFCPGWTDEEVEKIFVRSIELYKRTKPMLGAEKAVAELIKRGYDVRIVTMHSPSSVEAKHEWIAEHFPQLEDKVYYVDWRLGNKDVFAGYALIDDDMKNIKTNKSGLPILIDFYNIYPDSKDYIKCRTWEQVLTNL